MLGLLLVSPALAELGRESVMGWNLDLPQNSAIIGY
jgi:hypothetical protein